MQYEINRLKKPILFFQLRLQNIRNRSERISSWGILFFLLPPPAMYHLDPHNTPQQPALGDGWKPRFFILDQTIQEQKQNIKCNIDTMLLRSGCKMFSMALLRMKLSTVSKSSEYKSFKVRDFDAPPNISSILSSQRAATWLDLGDGPVPLHMAKKNAN